MITCSLEYAASYCSYLRVRWRVTEGLLPENPELEIFFLNGCKPLLVAVSMPLRLGAITPAA
jgi:hypothetical protein